MTGQPMEGTGSAELEIQHEDRGTAGAFFVEGQGRRLAELSYTRSDPGTVVLEHTEVSTALQGRGVARKLLDHAVAWARGTGTRLIPVCPYAKSVFDRTPELRDVLR
jgi:predicted GNAT family acetyltransferase